MQTSALIISPITTTFSKARIRISPITSSLFKSNPRSLSFASTEIVNGIFPSSSPRSPSLCCSLSYPSSSWRVGTWISSPPLVPRRTCDGFEARATSSIPESAAAAGESANSKKWTDTLLMFGLWYLLNIYCDIFFKSVLETCTIPATVAALQFGMGTIIVIIMWTFNFFKLPRISPSQLAAILPLAMLHTLGNLFINMSLVGNVAVSFTYTIKAMEPFFAVILSGIFLGETHSPWIVTSLVPIVGGVALASMTKASVNWTAFWSVMASNLTNQSHNVLVKKFMVKKEKSLDNTSLHAIITIMSFIMSVPVAIFMEGLNFPRLKPTGFDIWSFLDIFNYIFRGFIRNLHFTIFAIIYICSFLAALSFPGYQQVSYRILERVSPVTHSVGTCVKGLVVLLASLLFFGSYDGTPLSPANFLGIGVAFSGMLLYSILNNLEPKIQLQVK